MPPDAPRSPSHLSSTPPPSEKPIAYSGVAGSRARSRRTTCSRSAVSAEW
jgi:hypothetical protein